MTIGTRYITKDRKPLETLLPLESPLVLFVDPSDLCNLKCSFCPSSDTELLRKHNRPLQFMSIDLFKKIIDDLDEFDNPVKVVRMYGHGEGLLNPNFCNMVKYAKSSSNVEMVDTTTNAICLNTALNYNLIDSGIDRINISVNGLSGKDYKDFTGKDIDFNKFVNNIEHLYKNKHDNLYIFIKINGDTLQNGIEDEKKFLDIFEPIADAVAIERSQSCWSGFDSSKGFVQPVNDNIGIYGQEVKGEVLVCPYIMYSMTVNSNGKVSACFLDWSHKLIVGDVNRESIRSIWHGNSMNSFRKFMLEGKRQYHSYCRDCDQLRKGLPSNIDQYREELLIKYNFEGFNENETGK